MKAPRGEGWIQLYSGKAFYPLDPRVEEMDVESIIHGCSLENRYAGQTRLPITVGQHQCHVFDAAITLMESYGFDPKDKELARTIGYESLFHDAHEGLGFRDLPAPIKRYPAFAEYRRLADQCQDVVWELLGIKPTLGTSGFVHNMDMVLLATEKRDFCGPEPYEWGRLPDPLPEILVPWKWRRAEDEMTVRYKMLLSWESHVK